MNLKKTILFSAAGIGACLLLSSFLMAGEKAVSEKKTVAADVPVADAKTNISAAMDAAANWEKVYSFIESSVVAPIEAAESKKKSKSKVEYFSRCPSGIESTISSDSVKVEKYVYGKVNNWVGCSARGICYFRVLTSKKIAQVRDLTSKEYVNVSDWISKKYPKEVKG